MFSELPIANAIIDCLDIQTLITMKQIKCTYNGSNMFWIFEEHPILLKHPIEDNITVQQFNELKKLRKKCDYLIYNNELDGLCKYIEKEKNNEEIINGIYRFAKIHSYNNWKVIKDKYKVKPTCGKATVMFYCAKYGYFNKCMSICNGYFIAHNLLDDLMNDTKASAIDMIFLKVCKRGYAIKNNTEAKIKFISDLLKTHLIDHTDVLSTGLICAAIKDNVDIVEFFTHCMPLLDYMNAFKHACIHGSYNSIKYMLHTNPIGYDYDCIKGIPRVIVSNIKNEIEIVDELLNYIDNPDYDYYISMCEVCQHHQLKEFLIKTKGENRLCIKKNIGKTYAELLEEDGYNNEDEYQ